MAKKNRYINESIVLDQAYVAKFWGKWGVFSASKDEIRVSAWAKTLKEAIKKSEGLEAPIFFHAVPSATALYVVATLMFGKRFLTVLASPDSGAYGCVFSHEIAEHLGLDLAESKKIKTYGAAGFGHSFVREIRMRLASDKNIVKAEAYFVKRNDTPSLLGYGGLFDNYEVVFHPRTGMKFKYIK